MITPENIADFETCCTACSTSLGTLGNLVLMLYRSPQFGVCPSCYTDFYGDDGYIKILIHIIRSDNDEVQG